MTPDQLWGTDLESGNLTSSRLIACRASLVSRRVTWSYPLVSSRPDLFPIALLWLVNVPRGPAPGPFMVQLVFSSRCYASRFGSITLSWILSSSILSFGLFTNLSVYWWHCLSLHLSLTSLLARRLVFVGYQSFIYFSILSRILKSVFKVFMFSSVYLFTNLPACLSI